MTPGAPPPLPVAKSVLRPGERLLPTVAVVAAMTLLGDFLMWKAEPGLGRAIFLAAVVALLCARRAAVGMSGRAWFAAALLLGAAAQTAIEICLTNVVVVLVLLVVLLGEGAFPQLASGWARWWEAFVALCAAPLRWRWLILALREQPMNPGGQVGALPRALRIVAPAALLTVLFAFVLGRGNAIFANFLSHAFDRLGHWLRSFDFALDRAFFWLLLATLLLAYFRPGEAAEKSRLFARAPGLWRRADVAVARWQSYGVLAALNALFFVVNTIDVVFLWQRGAVPAGVDLKAYLHEGTHSVIAATVLSALVLGALFQQSAEVSRARGLRLLGHLWIAQTLVLLAGACLRWHLYLETTGLLTAKRIHLACFLALVALGFVFLVLHLERGPDLRRLLWRNAVAAFVLFYALQFINTTGLAAHRNVSVWQRADGHGLDLRYLREQGENAWPALVRVVQEGGPEETHDPTARARLREIARKERVRLAQEDWRAIQFRRDADGRAVVAAAEALGESPR